MTARGIRTRLVLFVILAAVGVVYIGANYLGVVDAALGRGFTVTAKLPGTGGLYEGGQVTYRGVNIGEVTKMSPGEDGGVDVTLKLEDDANLPKSAKMYVHNGSAVGEQYLDFEPTSTQAPYAQEGDVLVADDDVLPVDEADLIVDLDEFVSSVDQDALRTVISEAGDMFENAGAPLQSLVDDGTALIDDAVEAQNETISLLRSGRVVLGTQARNASAIRQFAAGLSDVSEAFARSDKNIRVLLQGGPATLREVRALLNGLKPVMPVLLSNLITVNQVATVRIPAIEQLLVTYPALIAGGFTGTTTDGFGHVHLQQADTPQPCTQGYLPPDQWRPPSDLSDGQGFLQAECTAGAPFVMRGSNYAPRFPGSVNRVAPYDAQTGRVMIGDNTYHLETDNKVDVYGKDAWKWLLESAKASN